MSAVSRSVDYAERPVVKPPVWTWEIPVYFFVGGIAGMSMLIVAVASPTGAASPGLLRAGLWIAVVGAAVSPLLLISDLGRPLRFLNMLRRFNVRSAMSMGVWILIAFSLVVTVALGLFELGLATPVLKPLLVLGGGLGALLATYTGVLLGATVIPVWREHRLLLPIHFGFASLGSAASLLMLLGVEPARSLAALLMIAIAVECLLVAAEFFALKIRQATDVPAPPAEPPGSTPGWPRFARWCVTLFPIALLFAQLPYAAGFSFLLGSLLSRFAWIRAGRDSALRSAAARPRSDEGAGLG